MPASSYEWRVKNHAAPSPGCKGDEQKRRIWIDSKVLEYFEDCEDERCHDDDNGEFNWRWMSAAETFCAQRILITENYVITALTTHLEGFSIPARVFLGCNKRMDKRAHAVTYCVRDHSAIRCSTADAPPTTNSTNSATLQRWFFFSNSPRIWVQLHIFEFNTISLSFFFSRLLTCLL